MSTVTAERESELKSMRICRFCLSRQDSKQAFTSIYTRDLRIKSTGSLPLQIMAISDIEVYEKDGMPGLICTDCRILFEHCYRFKQMCKKADVLLRQYPLTGCLADPLEKPRAPIVGTTPERRNLVAIQSVKTVSGPSVQPQISAISVNSAQNNSPKKILNAAPAVVPERPVPVRVKLERKGQDAASIFLSKVENDEELSMDDVQLLINDSCDPNEYILTNVEESTTPAIDETISLGKPKLLNKSSMRILNKEANSVTEPRLRQPQLTCDEDGNAVIVTQILDPNDPYEPETESIKNTTPIETNVFPCPHCERTFALRQLRDIHMVNHNRERSFKCPDCEKCFYSKYDLQRHTFVHSGEKPFKCHVCEKAFARTTLLHRHEKTHTDIPKFICLYCERPFISRTEMEKHTERHQKNRPFKCKFCDKTFTFKQGLDRHELTHSSEPPYPCQYCDKSFFTAGKLARHLTAHAGKRAFPCKYCPKSYLLSHHLTRHMRSHKQASSPFTCSVCNEVFKSYANLLEHSNVHATETLICPLCKETIDGPDNVANHIRTHTNGETYACEFCDLIYTNGSQLQEHIRQDHSVDMVPYQQADMQENNSAGELPDYIIGGYIIDDEADLIKQESNDIEFISTVVKEKLSNSKALNKINIQSSEESLAKRRKISKRKVEIETEEGEIVSSASVQKNIKEEPKTSKLNKSNAVSNVLKSLPKSVSVRRSTQKRASSFVSTTPELNKSTENSTTMKDKQAKNGTTTHNYPKQKAHK